MNNLGLYTKDKTRTMLWEEMYGSDIKPWKRTDLYFNDHFCGDSKKETNTLGTYVLGKKLMLNGEDLAKSSDSHPITFTDKGVMFGEVNLGHPQKCINITKANYIKLRNGEDVNGYARYNSKQAYNLTNDVDSEPPVFQSEFEQEDIIYNSYNGSLQENTLSNNTFTDVRTPTLAMRYFEPIINAGECLNLHYFVDTKFYDSVNKRIRTEGAPETILLDDTFTVIVENENGEVIYKNTSYAGEFRCKTSPFNVPGQTYISIRCIDNHGRGSVESYYDILVKDVYAVENIYNMTAYDLTDRTKVGENFSIKLNSGRADLVQGHKNRMALQNLINWVASKGIYTGIKLYRPNSDTRYYMDFHPYDKPLDGASQSQIDELERNPQLHNMRSIHLVYYDEDQDVLRGVSNDGSGLFILHGGGVTCTLDKLSRCEIKVGSKFYMNDGIPAKLVNKAPIDWVLEDGAKIYRDKNGKILVYWGVESDNTTEVTITDPSKDGDGNNRRLSIKPLSSILDGESAHKTFKKTGYYYCGYKYNGSETTQKVSDFLRLPDNFTLDMNQTSFYYTDSTDIADVSAVIQFAWNTNTHVKNGHIMGALDYYEEEVTGQEGSDEWKRTKQLAYDKAVKIAYIRQNRKPWESARSINITGSRFCTVTNVDSEGSGGYENTFDFGCNGAFGSTSSSAVYANYSVAGEHVTEAMNFKILGFIDYSGRQHGNSDSYTTGSGQFVDTEGNPVSNIGTVNCVLGNGYVKISDLVQSAKIGNTYIKNDGKSYDLENDSFCDNNIMVANRYSKAFNIGAYPEVFIYFYSYNNNQYTLKKVVKSHIFMQVKIPKKMGITHVRIGAYGLYNNGNVSKLEMVSVRRTRISSSCQFKDCVIHRTRSIAANCVGVLCGFKDCTFYDVQNVPKFLNITLMLWDMEERQSYGDLMYLIGCEYLPRNAVNGRVSPTSEVAVHCRNMHFENTKGFVFSGQLFHGYIVNNEFNSFNLSVLGRRGSNQQGIVKNNTTDTTTMSYTSTHVFGVVYNTCVEDVTKYVTLDDCFYARTPNANAIQCLPADHAEILKYKPSSNGIPIEICRRIDKTNTPKEYSLDEYLVLPDHFCTEIYTTKPDETRIICTNLYDWMVNQEDAIYVDDTTTPLTRTEKIARLVKGSENTCYLKIPTPGVHRVYVKYPEVHDVGKTTNKRINLDGDTVIRIPRNLQSLNNITGQTFNESSGEWKDYTQYTFVRGSDKCMIISLSSTPLRIHYGNREKATLMYCSEIIIPRGSMSNFTAAGVWGSSGAGKFVEYDFNLDD